MNGDKDLNVALDSSEGKKLRSIDPEVISNLEVSDDKFSFFELVGVFLTRLVTSKRTNGGAG